MKLSRRSLLMVLALLLCTTLAVGGTLAYLTDTDTKVNTFTMGNVDIELEEEFEQGAELTPGVEITKKPVITNTGDNDAWVWMTWSIPAAMDNPVQGTEDGSNENTIHWNPLGATTEGYVNQTRVDKAIADEHLEAGITAEQILAENMTWNVFNSLGEGVNMIPDVEIEGVKYNTYVLLYNKALEPGETTLPSVTKVFMDAHVDIDPQGNMYRVEKGVPTDLNWNIYTDGAPKIYVSAFAIQTEGFANVKEAYAGYMGQWATDGETLDEDILTAGLTEFPDPPTVPEITVASVADLAQAVKDGYTKIGLEDGSYDIAGLNGVKDVTIIGSEDAVITVKNEGENGCDYGFDGATVTFEGVTIDTTANGGTYAGFARMNGTYKNCTINGTYALYGNSTFENCELNISGDKYNIWTWGAPNATFDGCTFNSAGKALLLYGRANTNLTVTDCVFNDDESLSPTKTAIEIGNDYNTSYTVTVSNTTVNGFAKNPAGIQTNTTLWSNKNSMTTDNLSVTVDGVKVY